MEKENKKKGQVMNIINKLSVVISVYNEEAVLDKMYQAVVPVVESLPCEYELLFVNDGSKDASPAILDRLAMESEKVKVIHFSANKIIDEADNGASPSGKAPGFGPGIRRFESFRPRFIRQLAFLSRHSKALLSIYAGFHRHI